MLHALLLTLALLLSSAAGAAGAQDVQDVQDLQPVPLLSGRVIDQTGTLDAAQTQALEAKLAAFEAQAGPQIVVLMVKTTAPEDIASFAQRVADSWKIGRREVGDGVLMVVAKDERGVRIEVAKALEGAVPDLAARQIIDQAVVPAFRTGDYAGGLNAALDRLMDRVQGEHLPTPRAAVVKHGGGAMPREQLGLLVLAGVLVLGGLLSAVLGRPAGSAITAVAAGGAAWWLGLGVLVAIGAALAAVIVVGVVGVGNVLQLLLIMGSQGRGGGSGGGGGYSSGGGGDFGGGGASGRW